MLARWSGRPGAGLRRVLPALLRQRRRLALATVAIALGVGYVAGALTLMDRVRAGLDALAESGAERADLVVQGGVAYESPVEQVRRLVPTVLSESVAQVPGVEAVSSRVEDVAVIIDDAGRPVVAPGLSEQPLGANVPEDPELSPYVFVEGRAPAAADEVAIDRRSAEAAGVGVGDTVTVGGAAKVAPYEVVGVVRTRDGDLPDGSSLALLTTEEARAVFDRPVDDNWISVRVAPDADPDEVLAGIRRLLPTGIEVVDGRTAAVNRQESLTRSFTLVRSLIAGFAGLALVVGMVTVANSLALLYSERRRTFASLRLVGARQGQLMAAALVEAGLLALAASLAGAPLGVLLGRVIEAALGALDTSVPVAGSFLSWRALGWAVLIGVVATVVAAVWPARRACAVPPLEAVSESAAPDRRPLWRSLATALVVALVAGAGTVVLLAQSRAPGRALASGAMVAAGLAVLGLLPVVLSGLVAGGVRLVPLRPAALRRIAARDVTRNRARTAATAAALILATAVVAGLATFLDSFTASVDGEVDRTVTADLVVDSGTFTRGGLPADLLSRLDDLDGVAATSGWQVGRASSGLLPLRLSGIDGAALSEVLAPSWVGRAPRRLGDGQVLISDRTAQRLGAGPGSVVPIVFTSGGVENLEVVGVYRGDGLLLGDAVLDRAVLLRQVPATPDIAGLISLDDDTPKVRAAIEELAASYGVTNVLSPEEFVDNRAELLRGFQRVIQWMLLFTLVQALVGVVNTLLLSVGERRREFGLLRASGASRRQVLRLVLLEGISLAVVGTTVGVVLGVSGAGAGIRALSSLGLDTFAVPVATVVVIGLSAALLGILAAVAPARWASRVPPLDAVADVGGLAVRPRPVQRLRRRRRGRPAFHLEPRRPALHLETRPAAPAPVAAVAVSQPAPATAAAPPPLPAHLLAGLLATLEPEPVVAGSVAGGVPQPSAPGAVPEPVVAEREPALEPVVEPEREPVVEPELEPALEVAASSGPSAGRHRRPRTGEARSTRRRRLRARTQSKPAEGWIRDLGPTVPTPPFAPAAVVAGGQAGATGAARHGEGSGPARGDRGGAAPGGPGGPGGVTPGGPGGGGGTGPGVGGGPRTESTGPDLPPRRLDAGLISALARLDPTGVATAVDAVSRLSGALAPGEVLLHLVLGEVRTYPAAVARTDRRLLVVVERAGRPVTESLPPVTPVRVLPDGETTTVVVIDGRRQLRVERVRDRAEAAALAEP
jgi:putative ABC transport system permease protein